VTTLLTLLVGALIGAVLAVVGVAATARVLSPTAATVAQRVVNSQPGYDPAAPPAFYGTR
jgi:hypothetical protein